MRKVTLLLPLLLVVLGIVGAAYTGLVHMVYRVVVQQESFITDPKFQPFLVERREDLVGKMYNQMGYFAYMRGVNFYFWTKNGLVSYPLEAKIGFQCAKNYRIENQKSSEIYIDYAQLPYPPEVTFLSTDIKTQLSKGDLVKVLLYDPSGEDNLTIRQIDILDCNEN